MKIIIRAGLWIIMKIAMCFDTFDARKVSLIAANGEHVYNEIVQLPFEASSRIGYYSIDWNRNHIIWRADKEPIGELKGHFASAIPDLPLRIKLYITPNVPIVDSPDLIEHQFHIYASGYRKCGSDMKTELFVISDDNKSHIGTLITLSAFITCIMMIVIYSMFIRFSWKDEGALNGYILLADTKLFEEDSIL